VKNEGEFFFFLFRASRGWIGAQCSTFGMAAWNWN